MKIPLANPARELERIKDFEPRFNKKLMEGVYIGGTSVSTFEERIASYTGSKYCIAVNSGTDALLFSLIALGIKKGDSYNGILLKERIADDSKPDGEDLTNLYQNSGYLFSNINAVEVSAENDTINFEIRITEGKLASFNKISVVGNDKTNDNVIFRELRTKPGELYSKDKVVRTVRELGQLGFFDAEQIHEFSVYSIKLINRG